VVGEDWVAPVDAAWDQLWIVGVTTGWAGTKVGAGAFAMATVALAEPVIASDRDKLKSRCLVLYGSSVVFIGML
jgi:hypothetical protein